MIPPAPHLSPYIDRYEEGAALSDSNISSRQRQEDYEAEGVLYRALERLDENIIVLHSLPYRHGDYQLFVGDHQSKKRKGQICRMKDKEREEECDFVVMCDNCFVVIEVKNVVDVKEAVEKSQLYEAVSKTLEDSVDQRMRTVRLIQGISKSSIVYQFTACPNFSKKNCEFLMLNEVQISSMMFKEDIDGLSTWWRGHVKQPDIPVDLQRVKHILLALWSTEKNRVDKLKCSLSRTINMIDKGLRKGNITFKSKKRDPNPRVAGKTPQIIQDHVGVDNLTMPQLRVLQSDENLVWINGPAGSGKTVILCGKIIDLALSSAQNRIVLFVFGGHECNNSHLYQVSFDRANVKYDLITPDSYKDRPDRVCEMISTTTLANKVAIVEQKDILTMITSKTEVVNLLKGHHIFMDDVHCLFRWVTTSRILEMKEFVEAVLRSSICTSAWLASDVVQCAFDESEGEYVPILQRLLNDSLTTAQRLTLSENLRSTSDLAIVLSILRDKYIEMVPGSHDVVLPQQELGHYIHGPRIVIHVIGDLEKSTLNNSICNVVSKELDKFDSNIRLSDSADYDIGVITEAAGTGGRELVASLLHTIKRYQSPNKRIVLCTGNLSNSAEFPAVIALHRFWGYATNPDGAADIRSLYLLASRARVYCSLVLYPDPIPGHGKRLDDLRHVTDLFEKLEGVVQIIRHESNLI